MNKGIIQVDGKFYKKCKVAMLPTKESKLYLLKGVMLASSTKEWELQYSKNEHSAKEDNIFKPQHLYILSDEEIKEGDWYYNTVIKVVVKSTNSINFYSKDTFKKIIATTNPKLNLPRPSNAFLKAYCEQEGIDEVLVQYNCLRQYREDTGLIEWYTINVALDNTIVIKPIDDNSIRIKHLQWIYDRMVNVHNENPNVDYMITFKDIINSLKK